MCEHGFKDDGTCGNGENTVCLENEIKIEGNCRKCSEFMLGCEKCSSTSTCTSCINN